MSSSMAPHDCAYASYAYQPAELPHHYGPQVHLLADPVALTQLAALCSPHTRQPELCRLVRALYTTLVGTALAAHLPRLAQRIETRMHAHTPAGVWHGSLLDPRAEVVTVDIARAGSLPSQTAYELACSLLDPAGVRQDHIFMNRALDAEGRVVGVQVAGHKIGGPVHGALLLLPDPMGATGGSMCHTIGMYKAQPGGAPARIVSLNLIVTPEYVSALQRQHADVVIYAVRLDRGMSPADILQTTPGERRGQERGLNERQYIVPGAGGLGEVLNNSNV